MTDRKAFVFVLIAAAGLAACEDKPKETKASAPDAAGSPAAAVDPNLAEAVAAAGSKAARVDAAAAQGDGPPESGVFPPGKADEQLASGAPPKVALGDAGKEPRASLAAEVAPGWKQAGSLELALRLGRAALPALDIGLSVEAVKPKAPAAPAADGEPAAPAGDPAVAMVAKITSIKLTEDLGAQGKQLISQLGKMRGSRIQYRIVSGGIAVDFSYELAKGAEQELDMVLRAVAEALETVTVGFPKEPVGTGGYWLITTRGEAGGADVIAYRLVKVEAIAGDELTLSVSTKRYAATSKLSLVGLPPGTELEQFQSSAEGKLTVRRGNPLATGGTTKQTFVAQLVPAGQPDQRLGVQSLAEVTASFGKKD